MKTVICTIFVVFLFVAGPLVLSPRVVPNLSVQAASVPSLVATEQEIRGFFTKYVDLYNMRELEEFLLLFSLRARQNQRDGLPEIRMVYATLFNRSRSLQLSLEKMKIEIYQNAIEVKALFTVSQVLKEGGEKKVWGGDARWILAKEDDKLQILSIDYQYSIPPAMAGEKVPDLPPLVSDEEEVEHFFSNYVDRYNRKDIDGFLSFFSPNAVQNQKDGFEKVRSLYTKFFDESRALRYEIEDKKTEIYQNRVEVKARFRVEQTLKKGRKEVVWTGNIRWVLSREDGDLKIVSLDYQNEKSP